MLGPVPEEDTLELRHQDFTGCRCPPRRPTDSITVLSRISESFMDSNVVEMFLYVI